eukprot:SAG25_NODE_37_length_19691_cov_19.319467_10_plen_146_part_00
MCVTLHKYGWCWQLQNDDFIHRRQTRQSRDEEIDNFVSIHKKSSWLAKACACCCTASPACTASTASPRAIRAQTSSHQGDAEAVCPCGSGSGDASPPAPSPSDAPPAGCEVQSLERDEQPSGTCHVTDARGPGREAEVVGELRST